MEFEIIRADISLFDDIVKIENACFEKPWSANSIRAQLESGFAVTYLCRAGGAAAGYITLTKALDEGQIDVLAVLPEFRRTGIAERLFGAVFEYSENNGIDFLTLEVRASNRPALSLYEKLGFKRVGLRKKYYGGTEDAVLMTLERGEWLGKDR